MKKNFFWILGVIGGIAGLILFIYAQAEAANTYWYESSKLQMLNMLKWCGIALMINGVIQAGLKIYQVKYKSKHIKDVDEVTRKGGATKCLDCGLTVSADTKKCPRCGKDI